MEEYKNAKFEAKPSGYILFDDQEVAHTLQCAHCNNHFVSIKGSGIKRGWCHKCSKPLCGAEPCMVTCVPFEAKLDAIDGGNGLKSRRWDLDINHLIHKYKGLKF